MGWILKKYSAAAKPLRATATKYYIWKRFNFINVSPLIQTERTDERDDLNGLFTTKNVFWTINRQFSPTNNFNRFIKVKNKYLNEPKKLTCRAISPKCG